MTKKIRILRTAVTNPWFNLATENWILRDLDPDTFTLYLWRNDNTVVIGRYQNPWVECKVDKMEAEHIYLARRQSGGGAVFHDLGNTNFTFLSARESYEQDANFDILIAGLAKLGINAEKSGRNDVLVDGKKISGSAFRHTPRSSFHHGTVLVNADMSRLADFLNPNKLKLEAKGIKSVRSRVANLVDFQPDIDNEKLCAAIAEAFCEYHGQTAEVEWLDENTLRQDAKLNQYYEELSDWNWRFGTTPAFSHHLQTRFDWGMLDVHLDVNKAVITEAKIFSDALDTELIPLLEATLTDTRYQPAEIKAKLAQLGEQHPTQQAQINDVADWLSSAHE